MDSGQSTSAKEVDRLPPVGRPPSGRAWLLARGGLLIAFAVVFLAVRIPFAATPLWGEEGMFAHLLVDAPRGPDYLLTSRVGEAETHCSPEHPAPLYETVRIAGKLFRVCFPAWPGFSEARLTVLERLFFSGFQLVVFAAILLVTLRRDRESYPTLVTLLLVGFECLVALSPLAIRTSIALQIDGSSGALLMGVLPVTLLAHTVRPMPQRSFLACVFVGGVAVGLGKNEWSIALLLATMTTALVPWLGLQGEPQHRRTMGAIAAGDLLGNLLSFSYDRANWLGGFDVMTRIAREPGLGQASGLRYQLDLVGTRMPFLFVVLLLAALVAFTIPSAARRGSVWSAFLGVYGLVLVFGFLPSWRTSLDARYFAPGMITLLCASVMAFPLRAAWWRRAAAAVTVAGLAVPSALAINDAVQTDHVAAFEKMRTYVERARGSGACVPQLPVAYSYRRPAEFLADSVGDAYVASSLREQGKSVCPKPVWR